MTNDQFMRWLLVEIEHATELKKELTEQAREADWLNHDLEISRHEQEGYLIACKYIRKVYEKEIYKKETP